MNVFWFGHSCFFLEGARGPSLLLDPFHEEEVGYPLPVVEAEIVVVSHDHLDHNNLESVGGHPLLIKGPGRHTALGLEFLGVPSYHDREGGRLRGENTIFCFTVGGIRVCHLGDLGHPLSQAQVGAIGPVDLLFLPVGGLYTIDALGADLVMRQLHPAAAVPMHYQTSALSFELESVDEFLKGRKVRGPLKSLELNREDLGERGQVVLLSCPEAERSGGSID
ncbi:Beta-lactamase superfamily domain protein [uncultured archaeon]|nr:Beta-lactamase superfamily domain protein [uncultured archaeon]